MKKTVSRFLAVILVTLSLSLSVMAETTAKYVTDNGDVLSAKTEEKLEKELAAMSEAYGHNIAVVTFGTIDGGNIENSVTDHYDQAYGEDGIILGLAVTERQFTIRTYGTAQVTYNNYGTDYIFEKVKHFLAEDNFDDAYLEFAKQVEIFAKQAASGEAYDSNNTLVPTSTKVLYAFIALVIGLIIAGTIVFVMVSSMDTAEAVDSAHDFMNKETINITNRTDNYLYSTVTKVPVPKVKSSSGGGGSGSRGGSTGSF